MKDVTKIILALLICSSCSNEAINREKSKFQKSNKDIENFDVFFKKFSSDSVFQRSRIKFPLTVETYDIDLDRDTTSTIDAGQWEFFNIKELDDNYILTTSIEKDTYTVNMQKKKRAYPSITYLRSKEIIG